VLGYSAILTAIEPAMWDGHGWTGLTAKRSNVKADRRLSTRSLSRKYPMNNETGEPSKLAGFHAWTLKSSPLAHPAHALFQRPKG
jgi:hypothetical protein